MRLYIFYILILSSCSGNNNNYKKLNTEDINVKQVINQSTQQNPSNEVNKIIHYSNLNNTSGIVKLKEGKNTKFNIYEDSLLTKKIVINSISDKSILKLRPFAYHKDYSLLVFKCRSVNQKYYVVTNEENSKDFFIPKSSNFVYEDWTYHLLNSVTSVTSLNIDDFKTKPDEQSKSKVISPEDTFFPREIKGSWLRVENDEDVPTSSWLKWRNGDSLKIELFYFM
jgi:hypothetical protein